jgi:hypothetical protein
LAGPETDPDRNVFIDNFFEITDKTGTLYLGEGWERGDPYHMRNRKGNDFGKWNCAACNKLRISFKTEELEKARAAHETTWCPILNAVH